MNALEKLELLANMRHELLIRAFADAYGNSTCIRNYGDLTADSNTSRIDIEKESDDD